MKTTSALSQYKKPLLIAGAIGGACGLAAVATYLWKKRPPDGFEENFTSAFPRNSGAKSAVTGGDPEDMNAMPAAENPDLEGPIYDGSQLSTEWGKRSRRRPR